MDKAYEIQVFPHPKAPRIAHVSPKTVKKKASRTLCSIESGVLPVGFSLTGLAYLTGQFYTMV